MLCGAKLRIERAIGCFYKSNFIQVAIGTDKKPVRAPRIIEVIFDHNDTAIRKHDAQVVAVARMLLHVRLTQVQGYLLSVCDLNFG